MCLLMPQKNIQHFDRTDLAFVTDSLRKLLEIRNREEQTVALDDVHAAEIKEYGSTENSC